MKKHTPRNSIGKLIEPTRVFIAVLIVVAFWLAPAVFAPKERQETNNPLPSSIDDIHPQAFPGGLQVVSAQGCGPCQEFGCVESINNEYPEDGSDWTTCIRYGCVLIPACVPIPPTATLSVTCDTPGQGGWCQGGAEAELKVTNSQGQHLIISGNVNGNNFTCASTQTPCIVPLPEGTGIVTYVVSTDAGFTTPYSAPFQVDGTTPQIDGNINGSVGTSGWYTTQTIVTASASDAGSGIAAFEASIDGGVYIPYLSPIDFTDGIHTIQFRATDNAGNQTETAIQQIKVDTTTPDLSVAIAGSLGSDQWFVSAVTVTPTASDALSGLAVLEVSIDGGSYTNYQSPITFSDGVHSVQFRAIDQAGNISQTAIQQIKVDTITSGLSLSTSGTTGLNPSTGSGTGWYVSNVSVTPTASDSGSGINKVEALIDSGSWTIVNGPLSFSDGIHTYQIRATDNAGNVTQTPLQTVKVDTLAPALTAPSAIGLGSPLLYQISDTTSGLAWFQVMVEDKEGVLPVTGEMWGVAGNQSNGEYWWDGKVGGSMTANVGSYPYRMMAADQAGNQTTLSGYIEVEWKDLLYLELLPTKDNAPPNATGVIVLSNAVTSNEIPSAVPAAPEASFGGENNGALAEEETTIVTVTGGEQVFEGMTVQTGSAISFTAGNETTNIPNSNLPTTVLWGAVASALLGATLAEWQKKKEEDAALLAQYTVKSSDGGGDEEEEAGDVAARKRAKKLKKINPGLANAEAQAKAVKDAIAAVTAQELKTWERDRTAIIEATDSYKESENKAQYLKQELQSIRNAEADYREEQRIAALIAQVTEAEKTDDEKLVEYKQSESYLARQESYAEYYAQKEKEAQAEAQRQALIAKNEDRSLLDMAMVNALAQAKQEEEKNKPNWLDIAWNWAFNHQTEISFGTGVAIGAVAAIVVAASVITAPAWIVIGGVILLTAGIITASTLAINNHFDLAPSANLVDNIITGVVPALFLTGIGYLFAVAAPVVITAATNLCANNPTACSYVGPIVDIGEQAIIATQMGYYGLVGDQEDLTITTIEWQMELNDGGMPGNTLFNEASEQLSQLSPDALKLVAKYGDETIPLLLKYGDDATDAVRFLNAGEEVIDDILENFGDDTVTYVDDVIYNLDATVLGRLPDTKAAQELGLDMLDDPNWSEIRNFEWLQEKIDKGDIFYIGSQINEANLLSSNPNFGEINIFARELDMLLRNGYVRVGDYLVPGP